MKYIILFLLCITLIFTINNPSYAQEEERPDDEIYGYVGQPDKANPVQDVDLNLYKLYCLEEILIDNNSIQSLRIINEVLIDNATTDVDGEYSFPNLPKGTYIIIPFLMNTRFFPVRAEVEVPEVK